MNQIQLAFTRKALEKVSQIIEAWAGCESAELRLGRKHLAQHVVKVTLVALNEKPVSHHHWPLTPPAQTRHLKCKPDIITIGAPAASRKNRFSLCAMRRTAWYVCRHCQTNHRGCFGGNGRIERWQHCKRTHRPANTLG